MPWLLTQLPDATIKSDILVHLRAFANQSRMRRMLLGLMACQLSGLEANRLLQQFYCMDVDGSGTIELPELVAAARKVRMCMGILFGATSSTTSESHPTLPNHYNHITTNHIAAGVAGCE
jgi:hypothetical protein